MLFQHTASSKATNNHKDSEMSRKGSKKKGENLAEQYRDTYAQAAVFFRQLNVK